MEGEGQLMKSGRKFCTRFCRGLLWHLLLTSVVSAQVRQHDASQSRAATPFSSEPDWLIVSDDSQAGILQTDLLQTVATNGPSNELELPGEQRSDAETNPFEADLNRLQKRIDQLEASERKRSESDKKKKDEETKKAEGWQDMSTDKWTVKLGGHVSLDYINWANSDPAIAGTQDYFEFRRLRLSADGTGYGQCDFRLQMTLEPESIGESPVGTVISPDVKDAFFSMNEIPWLGRVRFGNFFVPFGLEPVTGGPNVTFLERSIPTQGVFSPNREVGIALYNCTEDQSVTWTTGVFFDSISEGSKERIDDNQGYRVSGRLTWTPFYDEPSNGRYLIHTGIGVLHTDDQDNRVRFRARPQIHEGPRLIDSGVLRANSYTIGNLEFAAVMGPLTLQGEAYASSVNMTSGGAQTLTGAYAHLSYFLTGENRVYERFGQHGAQFGRTVPYSNFFIVPGAISPGAWEVKTRYSNLNLGQVNKGQYNDITTGFNWYWSDRTRVMFDWIHPVTTAQTTFGATQSDLLAVRFDFNW